VSRASILGAVALVAGLAIPVLAVAPAPAAAPPAPATRAANDYVGPYFGENNFPPECTRDNSPDNPANGCYRIVTGLNGLDSPQVDVLVMVPVSATAERDMRIMRQSVEMWEGGIDLLARRMGLDWLADGVDFHVTIDYVDVDGGGGEFTTSPVVDPEIVVIATNPVGGAGIGVDPVTFLDDVGFTDEDDAPCHPVPNLLDFEQWEALPGFNSHHETRSGTYVEDCGPEGGGGNVCFAVNGAIDPAPSQTEDGEVLDTLPFSLFDLVSHEFGHCLTLGHVGDGGETILGNGWGKVPTNDIMSYDADPPGRNKCVSTLDVEAFALRMSGFLDVDGDGDVDGADGLEPNDQVGSPDGLNPLQVQHPHDHHYASSTGAASACPQPDVGEVPGERTDWTPAQSRITEPVLTVESPAEGAAPAKGQLTVAGTVEHRRVDGQPQPTIPAPAPIPASQGPRTIEHTGSFEIEQSTFGITDQAEATDSSHAYTLDVTRADVALELAWEDALPMPPSSDLDLFVTGAADAGGAGATDANPERVVLSGVEGHLDIRVRPTFVNTVTSYTLRITVTPLDGADGGLGAPDEDADGLPDDADACPSHPSIGVDGCTPLRATTVTVFVDGVPAGRAEVRAEYGADRFAVPVELAPGAHDLRIEWTDGTMVLASRSVHVESPGRSKRPRK
jgi:hypothetical protein